MSRTVSFTCPYCRVRCRCGVYVDVSADAPFESQLPELLLWLLLFAILCGLL